MKIGLVSKQTVETGFLKKRLEALSGFRVLHFQRPFDAAQGFQSNEQDAWVIFFQSAHIGQAEFLEKLVPLMKGRPILAIAKTISPFFQLWVKKFPQILILPYSDRTQIPQLLLRIRDGEQILSRKQTRHLVPRSVDVAIGAKGFEIADLSASGCRLRLKTRSLFQESGDEIVFEALKLNQVVPLLFTIPEVQSHQRVLSRVVWRSGYEIGFRFEKARAI